MDGVVISTHLQNFFYGECVEISTRSNKNRTLGLILTLKYTTVVLVTFSVSETTLRAGNNVKHYLKKKFLLLNILNIKFKSVINPLGVIFNKKKVSKISKNMLILKKKKEKNQNIKKILNSIKKLTVEIKAIGIIARKSVNTCVLTGIKILDSAIPIGRGQRELIIGDRRTGKTTLVLDILYAQTFLGEVDLNIVKSIYVFIGQKMSTIARTIKIFKRFAFQK